MPRPRNRATARAAGTKWESAIVDYLRACIAPHARRKAKAGGKDEGDVTPGDGWPVVIEAKDVRTRDLTGWVAEAELEAEHSGVPVGVVWSKVTGKTSPGAGLVIMSGEHFVRLLGLLDRST
jgi:hypothetical protein